MKALVWPVATYGYERWTIRQKEPFEIKGLRKILWVLCTGKKTNEWVLNKAGVNTTARPCQSTEASILWSHHEETRELPG